MFGIELSEIFLFLMQLGLAVSGAAALWGLVLMRRSATDDHGEACMVYEWIAEKLVWVLYGGIVLAGVGWLAVSVTLPALAHVGITVVPTHAEHAAAFSFMWPIFALWLVISPLGLFMRQFRPAQFHRHLKLFFFIQFIFAALLISMPAWSGSFDLRQFFFFSHSFHSIFTLGTVVVLDILFLISKSSLYLKRHIYPLFPLISKVILAGLAIELIGVFLVFGEALALTPKFFFMETVIGILLINGMVLAGPVTRRMIAAANDKDGVLARKWEIVGDVAGTISVTSWFTITFVDYFHQLTLSYAGMFSIYAFVLLVAIGVHLSWKLIFFDEIRYNRDNLKGLIKT